MTPLVVVELVCAALVAPVLFVVTAPYGRHERAGWGPTIAARAGWIIMESPAVLVPLIAFPGGEGIVLLVAWEVHYLQRTLIYPLVMRGARRMPLLTVGLAVGFNVLNGWNNGVAMAGWRLDAVAAIGLALFAAGLAINVHSDAVLRRLRAPGETGYKIPHGGLYRWVSAPNYLGELVEWIGFAVAARSWAAVAFALFTAANLVPRAWAHHRWYRDRFADYPRERRAIVPFIF